MNELSKRILSAIVLLVIYLFSFLFSTAYYIQLLVLGFFVIYHGLNEFYQLASRKGIRPFVKIGMFYSNLILIGFYLDLLYVKYPDLQLLLFRKFLPFYVSSFGITVFLIFLLIVHSFIHHIFTREVLDAAFVVSDTILGVIYIAIPMGISILLLANDDGIYYIMFLSVVTMFNDTAAYFGGKSFGKHSAGIKASPNKTWEGYIAGLVFSIIAGLLFNFFWQLSGLYDARKSYFEVVILAVLISILGSMGDLAESVLKRDAGVKDSSNLIPGHGGILDRIDSLLLTIPSVYFYSQIREIVFRLF